MDPIQPQSPTPPLPSYFGHIMRYGLILGAYMSLHFASVLLTQWSGFWAFVYFGMLLGLPVIIVLFARDYRRKVRNDRMTYLESVGFMLGMYLCAMIPFFLTAYGVLSVLMGNPVVIETMTQMVDTLAQRYEGSPAEMEAVRSILYKTPQEMALQYVATSMFLGTIYIYFAALFVKKS